MPPSSILTHTSGQPDLRSRILSAAEISQDQIADPAGHLQIRDLANSQLHAGIVLQRSTAVPVYVDVLCLQLYTAVVVATAAVAAAG